MNKDKHNIPNHYGAGGRLKTAADSLLVETAYLHDCEDADILLPYLTEANIAHLLVLLKGNILPFEVSKSIIDGLLKLRKFKISDFILDPANGDIYNNFDLTLKKIIGENAGWLHAGRPRREAVNIAFLLATRKEILSLILESNTLLSIIIKKSEQHKQTLMPDFTYLLHAQPTTLGHYLLTFAFPLKRDIDRLKEMYSRVNSSPGESGSVNGSRLGLDKIYFSQLLGFENISTHCRDAMWQPDIPLEIISKVASILMNIARLAEEFQIWNTQEFNYLDLPDSLCRASVIMPQKKNPYPLTYIRGLANLVISKFSAYGSYGRISSGNPDSRIFIYGDLVKTIQKTKKGLELFTKLVNEIVIAEDRLKKQVLNSDAYATDLADEILKEGNFNYREAHQIVGKVTRQLIDKGLSLTDLKQHELCLTAFEITGKNLAFDQAKINDLLNPEKIVASRTTIGGAAVSEMNKMLISLNTSFRTNKEWANKKSQIITKGFNYLNTQIKQKYG